MKYPTAARTFALIALCCLASPAAAHGGHHAVSGFISGFSHPLLGLDHLLAMIAIGLWAVQQGGRARWALPASFVAVMVLGGLLAGLGWVLPQVETGIALSALVIGLLVAFRQSWGMTAAMAIAAAFAVFHGYAHGLEMPAAVSPLRYALGFVLATGLLHGVGMLGGRFAPYAVRAAGGLIAASGLTLAGISLLG
jgi:urease accessory protein